MKSILLRFLLFFYLTSTYLGATHIHHDALESSLDCKVHVLVKNLNSADVPIFNEMFLECEGCYASIFYSSNAWVLSVYKGYNAQAPPYFS